MFVWFLKLIAPIVIFCVGFVMLLMAIAPDTSCVATGFVHDIEDKKPRKFSLYRGPDVIMKGRKVWFVKESGEQYKPENGYYTARGGERFRVRGGKLVMPDRCRDQEA